MNHRVKIFILLLILSLIISGCNSEKNESQNENMIDDGITHEEQQAEITLDVSGKDYDLLIRSEKISDAVVNLFGVDNATSIIFNDKAAVALEMADGYDFTENVKKTVIDTVKENDNTISEVLVSNDKQIFDEIESIIVALLNGKSYDEQVNRINSIIENIKK